MSQLPWHAHSGTFSTTKQTVLCTAAGANLLQLYRHSCAGSKPLLHLLDAATALRVARSAVEARQWPTAVAAALRGAPQRPSDAADVVAEVIEGLRADGSRIIPVSEAMRLLWVERRYATVIKVLLRLTQ